MLEAVGCSSGPRPTQHDVYGPCLAGARDRPFIPRLRSDPWAYRPIPQSPTVNFREKENRERRLHDLWRRLPSASHSQGSDTAATLENSLDELLMPNNAENMRRVYEDELLRRCCGGHISSQSPTHIPWPVFRDYAEAKEADLRRIIHVELDGNGHLGSLQDAKFISFLTQSPHAHVIDFRHFRDFLWLLPREALTYRYYEVKRFMRNDGRSTARSMMEGDVSLAAEGRPIPMLSPRVSPEQPTFVQQNPGEPEDEEEPEERHDWLQGHTAVKFLLAGGIAGAVSRTCTAPFDRLKVFLITRTPEMGGTSFRPKPSVSGLRAIGGAVARIYAEGGILAFWTGNGLSVLKIFPESAIKFMMYETAKRAFAKYWDRVEDPRDISGSSRFLSGGIGGLSSQLSIYPIETLKTQMMSITGQKRSLVGAARHVWQLGKFKAYYRGLSIGLVGVFPYSAIDMSTFEALKLTYIRSTGVDEPGVLALLAFGSVSGSVGAISVYPLNLVRTRLQASGSPGHPQRYTGIWDVVQRTYQRDGWRGFYRGLFPTLAKVVPSVSISYLVYEHSKRRLGV